MKTYIVLNKLWHLLEQVNYCEIVYKGELLRAFLL